MIYLLSIYLVILFLLAQISLDCGVTFILLTISVINSTSIWRVIVSKGILVVLGIGLTLKIIGTYTESKVIEDGYIERY
jgi:hypothetical protein